MEIHGEDAGGAGGGHEVGDELRADRHARRHLPVLTRVAVVRDDRRDATCDARFSASKREQQLHQVIVAGGHVDWITKTSPPRTFSVISTCVSPSLKLPSSRFARSVLR
jgi:hypothetical protein